MMKKQIKRLIIICMILTISISYAISKKEKRDIGDAVQVTSLPASNKVVILDAGHGTPDERCRKQKWNDRSTD